MKRWLLTLITTLILARPVLATDATDLGPAASVTPTSDTGVSNLLQPASPGGLQVTGNGATQASPSDAASLQVTTDQSAVSNYLAGENDGSTQALDHTGLGLNWALIIVFGVLAVVYVIYYSLHRAILRRRR